LRNPFDEIGAIGEIEIVDAERQCRPHDPIGIGAIGLERSGGVDHDIRRDLAQLSLNLPVAVERRGHRGGRGCRCRGGSDGRTKGFRLGTRAAGDDQRQPVLVGQQLRQPPTEGAVASEDQDLERGERHARTKLATARSITPRAPRRPSA
jgi:hypothetical protein